MFQGPASCELTTHRSVKCLQTQLVLHPPIAKHVRPCTPSLFFSQELLSWTEQLTVSLQPRPHAAKTSIIKQCATLGLKSTANRTVSISQSYDCHYCTDPKPVSDPICDSKNTLLITASATLGLKSTANRTVSISQSYDCHYCTDPKPVSDPICDSKNTLLITASATLDLKSNFDILVSVSQGCDCNFARLTKPVPNPIYDSETHC